MKRILVGALLALAACDALPTGGGDTRMVEIDRAFTLGADDRAILRGPGIRVQLIGVTEDTRCPIEADCVSAGHAVVQLRATQEGRAPAILTLRTDAVPARGVYSHHGFELVRLEPARSLNEPNPDYRVRLVAYPVFTID